MHRMQHDTDDGDEVVEDGGSVKVPLYLADGSEQRSRVSDALAAHNRYAGHRPGYVSDALAYGGRSSLDDASSDLIDRRGTSLEDAQRQRDEAFSDLCKRSQNAWKGECLGDADLDGDNNNNDPDDPDEDRNDIDNLRRKRDEAFAALEQRSQNAWRTSQVKATATELQGERWRGGR